MGASTTPAASVWTAASPAGDGTTTAKPAPPAGSFSQVATGDTHTCGVKQDGTVACWGSDAYGKATPLPGSFSQVSAGLEFTCGLQQDGSVACWGDNYWGQSSPPAGSFSQVDVGADHACGVRPDGSVTCWGYGYYGEATPPTGSFIQVSAGYWHTCGVRLDSSVACWGENTFGQSTSPTDVPDTTAPTVTLTTPTDGATYRLNQAVSASYSCADEEGGSGVKTCEGTVPSGSTIDTSSVGEKTFTVASSDNAVNLSSKTVTYTVAYAFSGFSQPVDNNVPNKAKAGQAIPLKWRLTDADGAPVTTLSSVQLSVVSLSCSFGTTPDAVEEYASGSSSLQNLGDGFYQFNWATPKSYAGSCKTLQLDLSEGLYRTAAFQFTR